MRLLVAFCLRDDGFMLTEVVFTGSSYLDARVDLEAKRECSDDIGSGTCSAASQWFDELKRSHPRDDFSGYLHFSIGLVPTGGTIDVVARDFTAEPQGEPLTRDQLNARRAGAPSVG